MDARPKTRQVDRERKTPSTQVPRGAKQIVIPMTQQQYDDIWHDADRVRSFIADYRGGVSCLITTQLRIIELSNNQPRPEAVVLGRPPEGAVYVRLPPLGAWSWSGPGFSQAPAEASPLMTNSRLIQCHARVLPSPDQNGKSTPDRSKLFGSHGQRPWF